MRIPPRRSSSSTVGKPGEESDRTQAIADRFDDMSDVIWVGRLIRDRAVKRPSNNAMPRCSISLSGGPVTATLSG